MGLEFSRVSVIPGGGVVARVGGAVIASNPVSPADEAFVAALIDLFDGAESGSAATARQVAALALGVDPAPTFAVLMDTEHGAVALLSGQARLTADMPGGEPVLVDAAGAVTVVERRFDDGLTSATLVARSDAGEPDPFSNLAGGVVRGDGVRLLMGAGAAPVAMEPEPAAEPEPAPEAMEPEPAAEPEPAPEAMEPEPAAEPEPASEAMEPEPAAEPEPASEAMEPEPAAEPEPEFTSIDLYADDAGDAMPQAAPIVAGTPMVEAPLPEGAPMAAAAAPEGAAGPEDAGPPVVMVEGIVCSRGHFTRPASRFCDRCGISMVQQTHNLVTGPRPPLGVLVLDDGSVHTLATDYVIGREPAVAEPVTAGVASPLLIEDDGLAMSRVHAHVVLDGWEVRVVDAHSANGTYVLEPGGAEWLRLEPGVPTTITAGSRVSMGGRTLTFESHQRD